VAQKTTVRQGQIPGVDYGISKWNVSKLRQWLQENMSGMLPASIAADLESETVTVRTQLSLSPAALADLKQQLGL
jgi:hypothetical protein